VAIVSVFTGRPVRHDVAITGEIDLRGHALPVGGIKEKVIAAHRAGIDIVFLPERNLKDTIDIPDEVKSQLEALSVKLSVRAGDSGRLYGSVTPAEIVDAVKSAGGPELDRRRVQLPGAVKSVGDYRVQVKLHPEVTATFTLTVDAAK